MVLTRRLVCHLGVGVRLLVLPLGVSTVDVVGPVVVRLYSGLAPLGAGVSLGPI